MSLLDSALAWQSSGVSVLPIRPDGTKAPAVDWKRYQSRIATFEEVEAWWGDGSPYGLAVVCGEVSGGLEMLELEGRAAGAEIFDAILDSCRRAGVEDLYAAIFDAAHEDAYIESSPSGGLHYLYRLVGDRVRGNHPVARRAAAAEELNAAEIKIVERYPDRRFPRVLAETRGEGGYVVVAPTSGRCHPSGDGWVMVSGHAGRVPVLTVDERDRLHDAIRVALDTWTAPRACPPPSAPSLPARVAVSGFGTPATTTRTDNGGGVSPGDDFEARVDWEQILDGWRVVSQAGTERQWCRPGKDFGVSATTGRAHDRDRLWVFSTSTVFEANTPYTKFGAYAVLHHNGDHQSAARRLSEMGYGVRGARGASTPPVLTVIDETAGRAGGAVNVGEDRRRRRDVRTQALGDGRAPLLRDDAGNATELGAWCAGTLKWVPGRNAMYLWDGRMWELADKGRALGEAQQMVGNYYQWAVEDGREEDAKYWSRCLSASKMEAMARILLSNGAISVRPDDFDADPDLLNLGNGLLNLRTGEFGPHRREAMQDKIIDISYDPDARAPQWEEFLERVLPDPAIRAYTRRAMGAALLGVPDQRAMFLLLGKRGTGKSQFLEAMRAIFADYGVTAPGETFRWKQSAGGATPELHRLRGSRLALVSEVAEGQRYDEETLKRVTGGDRVSTRPLYGAPEEWIPRFTLLMATNYAPRLSSTDDAVWERLKIIPFVTNFPKGSREPGIGARLAREEAAGILNWLLDGLHEFLAHGLMEPDAVEGLATEQQRAADPVAQWLEEACSEEDGATVVVSPEVAIAPRHLYAVYLEWCHRMGDRRPLGSTTFGRRLESVLGDRVRRVKRRGVWVWEGVGVNLSAHGALGTM